MRADKHQWFARIATLAVVMSVAAALMTIGSPNDERERKMDSARGRDLQGIQNTINVYWKQHKKLPENLEALKKEPGFDQPVNDPETDKSYEFIATGLISYQLCADFIRDSNEQSRNYRYNFGYTNMGEWPHPKGHHCFERKIDSKILNE